MEGVTPSTLSRKASPAPPLTSTTPPRRPDCRRGHGKPFSGTRSCATPTPLKPPLVAPDHPAPGMGHRRPTDLANTPPPKQRKEKGQRKSPRQGGKERPKVTGRCPHGQGTVCNTTQGQRTTGGPPTRGEGKARGHGTGGEGATAGTRTPTTKGHTTTEGQAPPQSPHPVDTARPPKRNGRTEAQGGPPYRRTPAKMRRRSLDLTPHKPHPVAPIEHKTTRKEGTPTQGEGDTPTQKTAESSTQPTTAT